MVIISALRRRLIATVLAECDQIKHSQFARAIHSFNKLDKTITTGPNPYTQQHKSADKLQCTQIEDSIMRVLHPFQREGVQFGIDREGRFLLADDMGLGKTLQAIAVANHYQDEWPLLVVCPSSAKYVVWKRHFEEYLPSEKYATHVIEKGSDIGEIPDNIQSLVVITSYGLMSLCLEKLMARQFSVIIFDESHMLKELNAKRTNAAFSLSKKAKRVLLLSGTPALSRPAELFAQIRLIDPNIFPNFRDYAMRFCNGKFKTDEDGEFLLDKRGVPMLDVFGISNPEELSNKLSSIMIRRLKKNSLENLPPKRREVVRLTLPMSDSLTATKIINKIKQGAEIRTNDYGTLSQIYRLTAPVRKKFVADHIVDTYFCKGALLKKLIVFGHHKIVLDEIEAALKRRQIRSIRIDGSTSTSKRIARCDQFQNDPETYAAVLSITAAGKGITLTAASCVVFAELYWDPSTLFQAEDRVHRVGQTKPVSVKYLLIKNTADEAIWRLISRKMQVLGQLHLSDQTPEFNKAKSSGKNNKKGRLQWHIGKPSNLFLQRTLGRNNR